VPLSFEGTAKARAFISRLKVMLSSTFL